MKLSSHRSHLVNKALAAGLGLTKASKIARANPIDSIMIKLDYCTKCNQILPITCKRCGYSWHIKGKTYPRVCANKKCKSPYWDRERSKSKKD